MRLNPFLCFICLVVFGASPLVWADSLIHAQLEIALRNLKEKDYEKAIARAKKPLDALQLNTVEDIILAHKILGVSYCEMGDQPKAAEHFDALVTFSPNESIDDLVRSKPCTEQYTAIQRAAKQAQNGVGPAPSNPIPAITVTDAIKEVPSEATNTLAKKSTLEGSESLRYIPFGVGQFKNNQPDKGLAFLSTEVLGFGVSLTGLLLFKSAESPDGSFENPDQASVYRGLYWGGLGVGTASLIWGIIDAVYVYKNSYNTSAAIEPNVRWLGNSLSMKF